MKKSKWIVTADWHFSNKNSKFRYNKEGVSDLLLAQRNFVKMLADELAKGEYSGIIVAGDVTDYATLDPVTATYFFDSISALIDTGKKVIILEGNHCISDNASVHTVVGSIRPFVDDKKCWCIINSAKIEMEDEQVSFWCFPYKPDYKAVEEEISMANQAMDSSFHNVMLFHFPTVNAVLDNGVDSKGGVNLSSDITSNFTVCLGGDFHKPQQLVNNDNAYYVGAPFDLKINQVGHRGVAVLDLNEDGSYSLSRLDNPFNYIIKGISSEETVSLIESGQDLSQCIVRVLDAPADEDRLKIEKVRSQFYSISVPSLRKIKKEKTEAPRVTEVFSKSRDIDVIKARVDLTASTLEVKQKAIEIFHKLVEEV